MTARNSFRKTGMRINLFFSSLLTVMLFAVPAQAQENIHDTTLITNVQIFDGHKLIAQSGSVRVTDGEISEVSAGQLLPTDSDNVINGEGKFLMPGLIDAHVHVSWAFPFSKAHQAGDTYVTATAVANASKMLKRGFTTVRDTAGTDYGLAYAIDEGIVPGPRIIFTGRSITRQVGMLIIGISKRRQLTV